MKSEKCEVFHFPFELCSGNCVQVACVDHQKIDAAWELNMYVPGPVLTEHLLSVRPSQRCSTTQSWSRQGPSRTQIIQQWTCTWWWALEGSRPVGPLETGEVHALAFTALSPLRGSLFCFSGGWRGLREHFGCFIIGLQSTSGKLPFWCCIAGNITQVVHCL